MKADYFVGVDEYGVKQWYLNNQRHREDGPAVEYCDGGESWYVNGKLHCENGPAVIRTNGVKEWWLNGKQVTEQEVIGKENESQV